MLLRATILVSLAACAASSRDARPFAFQRELASAFDRCPASGVVAPLTPTRYRVQACGEIATYVCQDATHADPVCTFETIADVVVPRSAIRARHQAMPPPTLQQRYREGALVPPGSYNPRTGEISQSYATGQYTPLPH